MFFGPYFSILDTLWNLGLSRNPPPLPPNFELFPAQTWVFFEKNVKKINSVALFLQNLVTSEEYYGKVCFFSTYCQINSASQFKFWETSSPVPPFSIPLATVNKNKETS